MINKHYDDCYFSDSNGYNESQYVFYCGNSLEDYINDNEFLRVGETGFGSGLNLLVIEDKLKRYSVKGFNLTFSTVEKYPLQIDSVRSLISKLDGVVEESLNRHIDLYSTLLNNLSPGWNSFTFKRDWGELTLNLYYGDVLDSFKEYPIKNDAWFLDGHSPDKNPDMWTEEVFKFIAKFSRSNSSFATFTAAGIVKRGLRSAGFFVRRKKGYGKKRHMIYGYLEKQN